MGKGPPGLGVLASQGRKFNEPLLELDLKKLPREHTVSFGRRLCCNYFTHLDAVKKLPALFLSTSHPLT